MEISSVKVLESSGNFPGKFPVKFPYFSGVEISTTLESKGFSNFICGDSTEATTPPKKVTYLQENPNLCNCGCKRAWFGPAPHVRGA
jgi:hypothetical protein